ILPPDPSGGLDWLVSEFGKVTAEALLETDPRPHCTIYDEGALIALTTLPVADRNDLKNQREAAFWVERSRVVAVTDMPVEDLIGATPGKQATTAPTTPIHLITRVALRAADRLEPILDRLSDKTDDLEEEVLRQPTDRTRVGLNIVRRAAITIRRTVLPQRDALTTLETSAAAWYTQRDRSRLREAVGWMNRLAAEVASFSERAALVHEQITDRRAEQLNRALLILAAVTTIFMPLTLITGIIGMNVDGIPFAREPWAFGVVILVLALIGVLEFLWFRSRKWL
ncbi:MAG TPA: CorA family divalent cation transporter, partial [Devosia sp.]|nr:CorA family divalent cation transporter [Devosia sp.]